MNLKLVSRSTFLFLLSIIIGACDSSDGTEAPLVSKPTLDGVWLNSCYQVGNAQYTNTTKIFSKQSKLHITVVTYTTDKCLGPIDNITTYNASYSIGEKSNSESTLDVFVLEYQIYEKNGTVLLDQNTTRSLIAIDTSGNLLFAEGDPVEANPSDGNNQNLTIDEIKLYFTHNSNIRLNSEYTETLLTSNIIYVSAFKQTDISNAWTVSEYTFDLKGNVEITEKNKTIGIIANYIITNSGLLVLEIGDDINSPKTKSYTKIVGVDAAQNAFVTCASNIEAGPFNCSLPSLGFNFIDINAAEIFSAVENVALTIPPDLYVLVGTSNKQKVLDSTQYQKEIFVVVTDAVGNGVPNEPVYIILSSLNYDKGNFRWESKMSTWQKVLSVTCENEDVNGNGMLDVGEDINLNLVLDPGTVATAPKIAVTDNRGVFVFPMTFGKQFGQWVSINLVVTTAASNVGSTDNLTLTLPVLDADLRKEFVDPPGLMSPWGNSTNCATTN